MNRNLSFFLSLLFHPVFVNLLSLLLLFTLSPFLKYALSDSLKTFYILFIFIPTGLLPVVIVGLLSVFGKAGSILLDDQDERLIPYVIIACLYVWVYVFCRYINSPPVLIGYLLASSCVVVAVLVINQFTKISIHAASLGALAGVLISCSHMAEVDIRFILIPVLVLAGLTGSARLFMNAHQPFQLYTGFLLGVAIMVTVL